MRNCFIVLCILASFYATAQDDSKIVIGKIETINSKILNEKRQVWVYTPAGGPAGLSAPVKYPVVYLLDGDGHFYSVVGMIQQLSQVNGNTVVPEMIVVGITNTNRTRDLTPTHVDGKPGAFDSSFLAPSGGGERFTDFIEKELMPYIDSTYSTLPYRTFIGHSLGGLMVMNTLVNRKDLFNAYIAIDPSMWWDERKLLTKTTSVLPQQDYKGKKLFIGVANTMARGMNIEKVERDTSAATVHIRSILQLDKLIRQNKKTGLTYDYKYYGNDSHGSVPLITTYDALRFIFSFYHLDLDNEDYMNFSKKTVTKIEDHYKNVSRQFGFPFPPPEGLINQMGYMALEQKKMEESEYLFKLNVTNYPQSMNVYDSLGDFYAAKGDKEKAVESYRKALSIKEWPDTRNKLNGLEK